MKKNNKLFYSIPILLVIISSFLLINSDETKTTIIGFLCLLFFGGGSIVYYVLEKKDSGKISKNIATIIGCLIFLTLSYSMLPFNHLFENTRRYNPYMNGLIGIIGIIFFGLALLVFIIKQVKRIFKK